jgi:DNA mismatch repair protein MutL
MTIEILPAQLANQIAAGEVVERPASVVKELLENSLDAGADLIKIDIEKGGAKRIRITDNGCGIVKEELALALSRHATSKIKNLHDLEGISSLGFRGEALASISSVARLTLTSKPATQTNAWQAIAQGRDMQVNIQPAAHPDGTTIDIVDLFFNTPARRKFLRTEKTEFSHIEEVIKRIALARFDVAITLSHNGKIIKQFKKITEHSQHHKRVAQVCGKPFIEHAVEVNCKHDALTLSGWVATPNFHRPQNDLCYSYVNGRMMRDKLINHAIRQAFADTLPSESYPAFVLFLTLDVRDVDVNVHPAKHEVRFHQGRYVHDFIYTVVKEAIADYAQPTLAPENREEIAADDHTHFARNIATSSTHHEDRSFITPLSFNNKAQSKAYSTGRSSTGFAQANNAHRAQVSEAAVQSYQQLLSPHKPALNDAQQNHYQWLSFIEPHFALCQQQQNIRLVSLQSLATSVNQYQIEQKWQTGIISQPLLLPVKLTLTQKQLACYQQHQQAFLKAGIQAQINTNNTVQIRQFPAFLRHSDVAAIVTQLIEKLLKLSDETKVTDRQWCTLLAQLNIPAKWNENSAKVVFQQAQLCFAEQFNQHIDLNSVVLDLTSAISKLEK